MCPDQGNPPFTKRRQGGCYVSVLRVSAQHTAITTGEASNSGTILEVYPSIYRCFAFAVIADRGSKCPVYLDDGVSRVRHLRIVLFSLRDSIGAFREQP